MTKTRTSRRPVRGGLVQAKVGIVGMAVVTLLVSLAGLWFSHELKGTTERVRTTTLSVQASVEAYKTALKSAETSVVLFTDQGTKSDNKNVEVTATAATSALVLAERDTKESVKLLDQVIELLATYETVTVTFGASAFIFALFVAIRRFRI